METKKSKQEEEKELTQDIVDEVGEESFPASDPPSWTTGIAHPQEKKEEKKEKTE